MRLFIAINLPDRVKASLAKLIDEVRVHGDIMRWTRAENIHLTLKFLGEVSPTLAGDVEALLQDIVSCHPPFRMVIEGVGAFPNVNRPRIVWVGVRGDRVLEAIRMDLEDGFSELGFEREDRPFKPHLTIGRIRRGGERGGGRYPLSERLERAAFAGADFTVTSVELMESFLKPAGAEYTIRKKTDLTGPEAPQDE